MVRLRRASLVAVVVGATAMFARTPAARQARVADTIVLSNAALALSTPTNPLKTADLVSRVLAAAKAPSGFEHPALDPDAPPPFDFGAAPVELSNLAGMRLGQALDAIARVDSSVRWSEHDGVVVVRMGPTSSDWLDQPSRPADYRGSNLSEALKVVASSIDPDHERAVGPFGFTIGPPASPRKPLESESPFALSPAAGSAEQVLDAFAREAHVRWDVTYSSAEAGPDSANLEVRASAGGLAARISRRSNPPGAGGAQRVLLSAGGGIGSALFQYARAAHVTVGLVALPMPQPVESFTFAFWLDPTTPAQSIARLVAYDSRYQWKEERGVFHVWPTTTIPTGLDTPTRFFSASAQPLSTVVARLIELTGRAALGPISVTPGNYTVEVSTQQRRDVPALPVSVTIQDVDNAEGVLDQLCQSQGWSWQWRVGVPRNPGFLSIESNEGWSVSQRINAVPTILQPPSSAGRYPSVPKDYPIARAGALIGGAQDDPFRGLFGSAGSQPIALELEPFLSASSDPRVMPPAGTAVPLGPGTFGDGLATLLDHLPAYSMTTANGLIEIAPRALLATPTHFLNVPIDHFEVRDATIGDAVRALRHRLDPKYPLMESGETTTSPGATPEDVQRRAAAAEAVFSRHISLSVDRASPREILNRLVLANQDLRWTIRYDSNPVGSPVRPIEQDCVVVLSTFPGIGVSRLFGPAPRPGSGAGRGLETIPPGPAVAIVLPTDEDTLRTAIGDLGRRLQIRVGVLSLAVSRTPGEALAAQATADTAARYNVAGLAEPALFDHLLAGLPRYTWKAAERIVHIEPVALRDAPESVLNRPAEHFDADFRDLSDAAVRTADFIAGRPLRATPSGPTNAVAGRYDRAFHVSLEHGTVRDLLDELARQQGYCSWVLTTSENSYNPVNSHEVTLWLIGFDGRSTGSSTSGPGR